MEDRYPPYVIDQMIDVIPKQATELLDDLAYIRRNGSYRPPEMNIVTWREIQSALLGRIGVPPTKDWHFKVLSIFSTTSEKKLREFYNYTGESTDDI